MPDQKISQLSSGTNAQAGDLFVIARGASNFNLTTAQLFNAPSATATLGGLNVDSGTLFVDAVNNRVGVGTASPGYLFHASTSAAATTVTAGIQNTASDGNTRIALGNNAGSARATISLNNNSNERMTIGPEGSFPLLFQTDGNERARLDASGNLGLGVTPSAWSGLGAALQVNRLSLITGGTSAVDAYITSNAFWNGTAWTYIGTAAATQYIQNASGDHRWRIAPSGTAGNAITFTQAMTLDASGNLTVGSPYVTNGKVGIDGIFSSMDAKRQFIQMGMTSDVATFRADWFSGAGGASPAIAFQTGGAERARITAAGSFVAGGSVALATTATDGFLYVPTCAGTPTGTPTAITGMAPIVVDTTNNKLYFYSNAAWRDAGP